MVTKMTRKTAKPRKVVPDDDGFLPTVGGKVARGARHKAEIPKTAYDRNIAPFTKSSESFIAEIAHELPIWADRDKLHSAAKRAGVLVRAMRNYAGLTQEVLGQDANIKQSVVSAIESGSGENGPTFELLTRVAEACDCYGTFGPKTITVRGLAAKSRKPRRAMVSPLLSPAKR
jgi:DNA-binding XRE family transcriptional regulator